MICIKKFMLIRVEMWNIFFHEQKVKGYLRKPNKVTRLRIWGEGTLVK